MALSVRRTPASPPEKRLEERFQRLAARWREETAYFSSATKMFAHPAYQEIIGLGRPVVPLLLQDLEKEPEHWAWAALGPQ